MNDKKQVFVDTNILVYALDKTAGKKHLVARDLVIDLWEQPVMPVISIQVLQELYVNLIKKNISEKLSKETITDYLEWHVVVNDSDLLMKGLSIKDRYKLSFWDSLIVAAAQKANASYLLSEDMQNGQEFDGVRVVNPFKTKI